MTIIVALDVADYNTAISLAKKLNPKLCRVKIGKQLFTKEGPKIIAALQELGFEIFLDLKYHDIPNTVAKACIAAAELGVWMINLHASGGKTMMLQAREAIDNLNLTKPPLLIAVTVLTSFVIENLAELGIPLLIEEYVTKLTELSLNSGMDGVVCSAKEAKTLRNKFGNDFTIVTPGIRLAGDDNNDQKRVVTPQQAINAGSNYLVMGRAITNSVSPSVTLENIAKTLVLDSKHNQTVGV